MKALVPRFICGGCGQGLTVRPDTDGSGELVDVVDPCKRCSRPRIGVDAFPSSAPTPRPAARLVGSAYTRALAEAKRLAAAGVSRSQIAKETGLGESTIYRVRRDLREAGQLPPCGCGRPADHRGVCPARRAVAMERRS